MAEQDSHRSSQGPPSLLFRERQPSGLHPGARKSGSNREPSAVAGPGDGHCGVDGQACAGDQGSGQRGSGQRGSNQWEKPLINSGSKYAGDSESEKVSSTACPKLVKSAFCCVITVSGCVHRRLKCSVSFRAPQGRETSRTDGWRRRGRRRVGTGLENGPHSPKARGRPGTRGQPEPLPGPAPQSKAASLPRETRGAALGAFD